MLISWYVCEQAESMYPSLRASSACNAGMSVKKLGKNETLLTQCVNLHRVLNRAIVSFLIAPIIFVITLIVRAIT